MPQCNCNCHWALATTAVLHWLGNAIVSAWQAWVGWFIDLPRNQRATLCLAMMEPVCVRQLFAFHSGEISVGYFVPSY